MAFPVGDPRAKAAGIVGGTKSGATRRKVGQQVWREKFPQVDPVVANAIYRMGYQAAWRTRKAWKRRSSVVRDAMGLSR